MHFSVGPNCTWAYAVSAKVTRKLLAEAAEGRGRAYDFTARPGSQETSVSFAAEGLFNGNSSLATEPCGLAITGYMHLPSDELPNKKKREGGEGGGRATRVL